MVIFWVGSFDTFHIQIRWFFIIGAIRLGNLEMVHWLQRVTEHSRSARMAPDYTSVPIAVQYGHLDILECERIARRYKHQQMTEWIQRRL